MRAFLTPDLFKAPVQWPRLRRLRVEFHTWRPDGSWYFVGPHGENPNPEGFKVTFEHYPPTTPNKEDNEVDNEWREDEGEEDERQPDMFRTEPLAEEIEPLISAFSTALKSTPTLKEAELFTYLAWKLSEETALEYTVEAPYDVERGVRRWDLRYVAGKNSKKGLVECQFGDWRPTRT